MGVGGEVLSLRCQQGQGGLDQATSSSWGMFPSGEQEWELSPVPLDYPDAADVWPHPGQHPSAVLSLCSLSLPSLVKLPSSSVLVVTGAV